MQYVVNQQALPPNCISVKLAEEMGEKCMHKQCATREAECKC